MHKVKTIRLPLRKHLNAGKSIREIMDNDHIQSIPDTAMMVHKVEGARHSYEIAWREDGEAFDPEFLQKASEAKGVYFIPFHEYIA